MNEYTNDNGLVIKTNNRIHLRVDKLDEAFYLYFRDDIRFYIDLETFTLVLEKFNQETNQFEFWKSR